MRITDEIQSDKLRGGYYTPSPVADWLCRWAIRSHKDHVLEPSSGDGIFLQQSSVRLKSLGATSQAVLRQIQGVEIIAAEVNKSRSSLKALLGTTPNGSIVRADFFEWMRKQQKASFDCVVGNPPFIRYQNVPEPARSLGMDMLVQQGLRANRLTNIWVPFVVGAASLLADGGRMALVLPAELLQVTYAAQLRQYLADHFQRLHIFACNHLFFEGAEQEVVLLLADGYSSTPRPNSDCLIELIELDDMADLLTAKPNHKRREDYSVVNHSTEKWLKYFLTPHEIGFMRALRDSSQVVSLDTHASIDVGVVTGRNDFFVVDKSTIKKWKLEKFVMPLVGRSSQLRGAAISKKEWAELAAADDRVYLLMFGATGYPSLTPSARNYVAFGESNNAHTGFKCSIRNPWYTVPSVWVPDCLFFRQIYDFPRIVSNLANATSTDTIHRMRCKGDRNRTITNLYTHLAGASAEIEGRSYGGGVLELEPTEAERVLMPQDLQTGLPLKQIDAMIRQGRLQDVLRENDRLVLQKIGLSVKDCRALETIWIKMRDRRRKRTKSRKAQASSSTAVS